MEFHGWPGKFRKDLESQEKVREFENKWLWQAFFRKFIYSVQGLTNQKNFHLPTGQVKKQITCPVEKLACPDSFFQK